MWLREAAWAGNHFLLHAESGGGCCPSPFSADGVLTRCFFLFLRSPGEVSFATVSILTAKKLCSQLVPTLLGFTAGEAERARGSQKELRGVGPQSEVHGCGCGWDLLEALGLLHSDPGRAGTLRPREPPGGCEARAA